jgi:hypothetical protein
MLNFSSLKNIFFACRGRAFFLVAVLVTPPLSLMGETHTRYLPNF